MLFVLIAKACACLGVSFPDLDPKLIYLLDQIQIREK